MSPLRVKNLYGVMGRSIAALSFGFRNLWHSKGQAPLSLQDVTKNRNFTRNFKLGWTKAYIGELMKVFAKLSPKFNFRENETFALGKRRWTCDIFTRVENFQMFENAKIFWFEEACAKVCLYFWYISWFSYQKLLLIRSKWSESDHT